MTASPEPHRIRFNQTSDPAPERAHLSAINEDAYIVLDVENLLFPFFDPAGPGGVRSASDAAVRRFGRLASLLDGGRRRIVAVGDYRLMPHLLPSASRHNIRLVPTAPGTNSADVECVRRLVLDVPHSSSEVVIGAGDGIYALPARWLSGHSKATTALVPQDEHGRPRGLSRALARSVDRVISVHLGQ